MATIDWTLTTGIGDWSDASNWSTNTVPGAGDTAVIDLRDQYTVHVDGAFTLQEVDFGYKNAYLVELAAGTFTAHKFEISAGVADLRNANSFDNFTMDGGTAAIKNDHALGTKAIHFNSGDILANGADINLHNKIDIQNGAGFAASGGQTLTVSGPLIFDPQHSNSVVGVSFGFFEINRGFNTSFGGTVDITSTSFEVRGDMTSSLHVSIEHGIVKSGQGDHAVGANEMFSSCTDVVISSAVLDVRNFGTDVTLHRLSGSGGSLIGNSGITIHADNPYWDGTLQGVTMDLGGTGHMGGNLGHAHITMAAGTNTIDFSAATAGLLTISAPDGSTSTITVGAKTSEHFTDFQDGNLTIDTTTASTASYTFEEETGDIRLVIHPGHGAKAFSLFFDGATSSDGITVGDDGHGHLQVAWTDPAGALAHAAHDIDVAHQAAEAAFVPLPHDHF